MRLLTLSLAAALLVGCAPVVNQRGYLPDPVGEASIRIGSDTKTTIQAAPGRSVDPGNLRIGCLVLHLERRKAGRLLRPPRGNTLRSGGAFRQGRPRRGRSAFRSEGRPRRCVRNARDAGQRQRTHLPAAALQRHARCADRGIGSGRRWSRRRRRSLIAVATAKKKKGALSRARLSHFNEISRGRALRGATAPRCW